MLESSIIANFPGIANARMPDDVVIFFDDFLGLDSSASADLATWLSTVVAQAATGLSILDGTDDAEDEAGGVLKMTTEATAADGENMQVNGEAFHLADGYPLIFKARFNIQDVSNSDFFIGLAQTDAEIITGGVANRIGFELAAGTLNFVSEDATAQKTVDTVITETDDQWVRVMFTWDGDDNVAIYIDDDDDGDYKCVDILQASVTADYIPQAIMTTPTIEHISGTTASAESAYVDYIYVAQQRYRA